MRICCSQVCTGFAFTALKIRLGQLLAVTKRMKWDKPHPPRIRPGLRASHPTNNLAI